MLFLNPCDSLSTTSTISVSLLRWNKLWVNNKQYNMELVMMDCVLSGDMILVRWLIDVPVGEGHGELPWGEGYVEDGSLLTDCIWTVRHNLCVGETLPLNHCGTDTNFRFLCPPKREAKLQLTYLSAFVASFVIIVSASLWSLGKFSNTRIFFNASKISGVRIDKLLPIENQQRVMR